jgi:hypothetical protein
MLARGYAACRPFYSRFAVPFRGDALAASNPAARRANFDGHSYAQRVPVDFFDSCPRLGLPISTLRTAAAYLKEINMSIPNEVHDGADVPAGVNALKQPVGHVTGPRFAGGEVRVGEYQYQRTAPPGVQTWRNPATD